MLKLTGYELSEIIREGRHSTTFRGKRLEDNTEVVVKWRVMSDDYSHNLQSLKNELDLTQKISSKGVVSVFSLIETSEGCALVLEDFGGVSLRDLMMQGRLGSFSEKLELALRITEILGVIHQKQIIHKDVNPGNIIINPLDGRVKLTDFGISTALSREEQEMVSPDRLEGTLAYISPEQTGRMNRAVDYRTDIYSLGVTLYELFTGERPFEAQDAIGWVHAHMALTPPNMHEKAPEIPSGLSFIVQKMMEKNVEDRYLSAVGVKADLQRCLGDLKTFGEIHAFVTAEHDYSDHFQISQKLYGRDEEVKAIMEAFAGAASGRAELMLLAGVGGIGKSSLVHEIQKPIVDKQGFFISGKFDQFKRNIPYLAIVEAFRRLVEQLVTGKEEILAHWKTELLTALGSNGQLIIDVIPDMEFIIGKQPAVPALGGTENQNRFNSTFSRFIGVFTKKEHPLVIFLDDLQWADTASLNLIRVLMQDEDSKYFFMIGAYRDNQVDESHPFIEMLEELRKNSGIVKTLTLKSLELQYVNQLIAETLHVPMEDSEILASIVLEKTDGNPFFVNEFLRTLYDWNLLQFDLEQRRWVWRNIEIEAQGITDNVVDLIIARMRQLPKETQWALQLGACISNVFDLGTLAVVMQESPESAGRALWPCIRECMLIPMGETRELLHHEGDSIGDISTTRALRVQNRFQHDRVQQAAYALIPEAERMQVHLTIGKRILQNTKDEELEERIFGIAEQMNKGYKLLETREEKLELAKLNLRAGEKAKANTAYASALECLTISRELLPDDGWESEYDLTLAVYRETFTVLSLLGRHEESDAAYEAVLRKAKTREERYKINRVQLLSLMGMGRNHENLELGLRTLKDWGVEIPSFKSEDALEAEFKNEYKIYEGHMRNHSIQSLLDLPEMADAEKAVVMDILFCMLDGAFFGSQPLLRVLSLKMVNLSIQYGNAPASVQGYSFACFPLVYVNKDYDKAYEFGKLAVALAEKYADSFILCRAYHILGTFTGYWKEPLGLALNHCMTAYAYGLESGDHNFATYASTCHNRSRFYAGDNLPEILWESEESLRFMKKVNNVFIPEFHKYIYYAIKNFQDETRDFCLLGETPETEKESFETYKSSILYMSLYYNLKCQLHYYNEDFEKSYEYGELAWREADGLYLTSDYTQVPFYRGLAMAALYEEASEERKIKLAKQLDEIQELLQIWAKCSPQNFEQKYLLLQAELTRIKGDDQEAMDLYDRAIESARKHKYLNNEALACEVAGRYWLGKNKPKIAGVYFSDAVNVYRLWGAKSRIRKLKNKYPELIIVHKKPPHRSGESSSSTYGPTSLGTANATASAPGSLDLNSVVKSSHAMAGEIQLEALLEKIMGNILENAGAERGLLILEEKEGPYLVAEGNIKEDLIHLERIPLRELESQEQPILALGAVWTARRTGKNLILDDAGQDQRFSDDPYVLREKTRSLLCLQIVYMGGPLGLLYLENNLTSGVFTPDRLEVLNLLATQIAISLNNARLYSDLSKLNEGLEERVKERTLELEQLAATDPLTGISNRRHFMETLEKEMERSKRYEVPFSLVLVDLDNFKNVNDTHGHDCGDDVLRAFTRVCLLQLRLNDLVGRLGGEEFGIILPGTKLDAAESIAERLRKAVSEEEVSTSAGPLTITASLGVSEFNFEDESIGVLFKRADLALYSAKNAGRNQVKSVKKS